MLCALLAGVDAALPLRARAAVDCQGTAVPNNGRLYADGYISDIGAAASGIRGTVWWTNPNVCTTPNGNAFSLEAVTLCSAANCNKWVQPGWRKDQGNTTPHGVCEYHDSTGNHIFTFGITTSSHTYQMSYDSSHATWTCRYDSTDKFTWQSDGFSGGDFVNAQGETNAQFAQIGKVAPNDLPIDTIKYFRGGAWNLADLALFYADPQYDVSEGPPGTIYNWTK